MLEIYADAPADMGRWVRVRVVVPAGWLGPKPPCLSGPELSRVRAMKSTEPSHKTSEEEEEEGTWGAGVSQSTSLGHELAATGTNLDRIRSSSTSNAVNFKSNEYSNRTFSTSR